MTEEMDNREGLELTAAGPYRVGKDGVSKILLCRDGAGPTGWYDMIYIYAENGDGWPWKSLPAHLTDFWER